MLDVEESMLDVATEERDELRTSNAVRRTGGEPATTSSDYPAVETRRTRSASAASTRAPGGCALRQCLECGNVGLLRLLAAASTPPRTSTTPATR